MTQEYRIWKPEHDGHAPPNWREGMRWTGWWDGRYFNDRGKPDWLAGDEYYVETEALNSPNDDAEAPDAVETGKLENIVRGLRQYPAEELAKHGIMLVPERDWATELWADVLEAWDMHETAELVRRGAHGAAFIGPINLLRTRFEQMIAERSKRDA